MGGSEGVAEAVRHWRRLGVSWVTVLDPREELLAAAREAGIEVVARVYSPSIYQTGDIEAITRRMVAHGMRYVIPYNEPNLRVECAGNRPDPVDFARRWVEAAEAIGRHHGYPVLTPLAPEGDYPDYAYFRAMLAEVVRLRGVEWLLDLRVVVGVHAYIMRPGGDFRERFYEYNEIVKAQTGLILPMLATEGGVAPGLPAAAGWSPVEETVAVVRTLLNGGLPDYVLGASLWVYSNRAQGGHDARFEKAAWVGPYGPRPIFEAVEELHGPAAVVPRGANEPSG